MSGKILRVVDLETGAPPTDDDPGIIEIGWADVRSDSLDMLGQPYDWHMPETPNSFYGTLVKSNRPIPPDAMAIHGIEDEDCADAPSWSSVAPFVKLPKSPTDEIVAFVAHNIKMEKALLGEAAGDLPWICTYKVALRLWPDCPSHSNGCIRYYIRHKGLRRELAGPTHRALPDAYVSAHTLLAALELGHSYETLIRWTEEPARLPRCKIGDYRGADGRGTPWEQVESSMLRWILGKDFDEDTKAMCRFHLEQREIEQRIERENADLRRQMQNNGMNPFADNAEQANAQLPF